MSTTPPGPLAEEAARLVEAITEWARGAVGDVSMPSVGNGPECQICPICQLLALLRRTQPETFGHLADASASMVAALRTVVDRHDHGGRRPTGVERIDLDERDATADGDDEAFRGRPDDEAAPPPTPRRTRASQDRDALADALGVGRNGRPGGSRSTVAAASTKAGATKQTTARRRSAPQKPAE